MKILVLGEAGVGKTSLVRRIATNKFEHSYLMTVGMDPTSVEISVDEHNSRKIRVMLWDIAGQAQFQIYKQAFYRGSEAALAVCDLTRPASLFALENWIQDFYDRCGNDKPVLLVGNKVDLRDLITITDEQLVSFQKTVKAVGIIRTSALTGENVLQALRWLVLERI